MCLLKVALLKECHALNFVVWSAEGTDPCGVKILVELCLIAPRPNSAHCHQTPNWCGEKLANAKARKQHIRIFVFLLTRLPFSVNLPLRRVL